MSGTNESATEYSRPCERRRRPYGRILAIGMRMKRGTERAWDSSTSGVGRHRASPVLIITRNTGTSIYRLSRLGLAACVAEPVLDCQHVVVKYSTCTHLERALA